MGLFGKSQKEYQAEISTLNATINEYHVIFNQQKALIDDLQQKVNPDYNALSKVKDDISTITSEYKAKKEELDNINNTIFTKQQELYTIKCQVSQLQKSIYNLNDEVELQEYGLYNPTFTFASSDLYKDKLQEIRSAQKECVKKDTAAYGKTDWTVRGSKAQGTKMVKDMKKLLLRAFNLECDDVISNVRISNLEKSNARIRKAAEQISSLGNIMGIFITEQYISLKIDELNLALDFEIHKQEEKERIRELKEQQREEAKAQKEIEEARKKLQKEQTHYKNALIALSEQIANNPDNVDLIEKKKELESTIEEVNKAIADVDYREANKKAGYVYIISNIGAFGKDVYKIGMTRRLEPMERINELGDASVPFSFDVHALIFSDNAPQLETALHKAFENKKVNRINLRREFFKVSLEEIKEEVRKNFDKTVEWADYPEAEQYRQSIAMETKE